MKAANSRNLLTCGISAVFVCVVISIHLRYPSNTSPSLALPQADAIDNYYNENGFGPVGSSWERLSKLQLDFSATDNTGEEFLASRVENFYSTFATDWDSVKNVWRLVVPLQSEDRRASEAGRITLGIEALKTTENSRVLKRLQTELHRNAPVSKNGFYAARMLAVAGAPGEQILIKGLKAPEKQVQQLCRTALHAYCERLLTRQRSDELGQLHADTIEVLFSDDQFLLHENGFKLCADIAVLSPKVAERFFEEFQSEKDWRRFRASDAMLEALASPSVATNRQFLLQVRQACYELAVSSHPSNRDFAERAKRFLKENE